MRQVNRRLKNNPNDLDALAVKLDLLITNRKTQFEAKEAASKALREHPNDAIFIFFMGKALMKLEENEKAEKLLTRAHRMRPGDSNVLYHLAEAEHRLGKNELALEYIDKYMRIDKTSPLGLISKAKYLVSLKRFSEALKYLDTCVARYPSSFVYRNRRIRVYRALKKWQGVVADCTVVIDSNQVNDYRYFEWRAEAYERLGKIKQAIASYSQAIERASNRRYLFESRAALYERTGQKKKARADRLTIKKIDSEIVPFSFTPDWTKGSK